MLLCINNQFGVPCRRCHQGENKCTKMKNLSAKIAEANLCLLQVNKNSTRKMGLSTSLKDAPIAEKTEDKETEKNFMM